MTGFLERLFKYREKQGRSSKEDYFTEALAGVLEGAPEVVAAFATWLTGRKCKYKSASVVTQEVVGDGRLDMWLEARDGNDRPHLIVLENKLDAPQGREQLRRYENYLASQKAESRTLVYVTIHERSDFQPSSGAVSFRNRHWFEVYEWLTNWVQERGDLEARVGVLTRELLELMEAWDMETNLGAQDLASAVAYKGRVQQRLLQILDEVWEVCPNQRQDGGQWAYDRNGVCYRSAYITHDKLYYHFGFDFERDDQEWNVTRLQLPSAYFGIRGGDVQDQGWSRLSDEWVAPPWKTWERHERVRQLPALDTKGASLHEGYLKFFLSSLEQAKAMIGGEGFDGGREAND